MPRSGWQTGCPFQINDVVHVKKYKKDGKVIGLTTKEDEQAHDGNLSAR